MIKKFSLILFSVTLAINVYAEEIVVGESPTYFGLGGVIATQPYKKADAKILPVPIIVWHKDKFYIEGLKAGYQVLNNEEGLSFDVVLQPRLMGYDDSDSDFLDGMQDRDYSLDAGVEFKFPTPIIEDFTFNVGFFADILSEYHGFESVASLSKSFKHEYFLITPNVGVRWQSEDLIGYYYGVRPEEATSLRSAYQGDDTFNFFASINYFQGLSEDWLLVTRFGIEWLGDEITDSSIVDENYTINAGIGIARKF